MTHLDDSFRNAVFVQVNLVELAEQVNEDMQTGLWNKESDMFIL